jgi:hypothetical protein
MIFSVGAVPGGGLLPSGELLVVARMALRLVVVGRSLVTVRQTRHVGLVLLLTRNRIDCIIANFHRLGTLRLLERWWLL